MKKSTMVVACGLFIALASTASLAKDETRYFSLAELINSADGKAALDGSVRFFLDGVAHGSVKKTLGSDVSNKKTNGFNKGDKEACSRAALSALIAFQGTARTNGANAVINLISYYKKVEFKSATDYECHIGGVVVSVTLKGDYVQL
jgi:uncharacterized protein YbjQ (UPF0145 family)